MFGALGSWILKHSGIRVLGFGAFWDWGLGFWSIVGLGSWVLKHSGIRVLGFGTFWGFEAL